MKSAEEIQAILSRVLEASKELYMVTREGSWHWKYSDTKEEKDIPNYYKGYRKAVMQSERISTHSEVDKYPEKLFEKRAPNQNEEESEYVRENYKNTTHPVYMDYLSITSRGLQDNNWSIQYPSGSAEADDYSRYITRGIDVFGSVENYVKRIVPSIRANDPNGVMTFYIKEPPLIEVDGEMVVADNERLEPQPKYFKCGQVVHWEWNTSAMFESHEKTVVDYNGKPAKVGRVFYFYDDTNIWKIEQAGKFIDHTFNFSVVFRHEMGMFPCIKLGGVPSILSDNSIYYTSRFYYAVDLLDWSLLYDNYLNVSIANVCFPFRWMVGDECDFHDERGACVDGKIATEFGFTDCPSCHGTGMKIRTSPMKTYLLKSEKGQDKGDTSFPQPIGFISPETHTLEFTKKTSQEYKNDARQMLHVYTTNDKATGSDDTATGKLIDLKAMYAFVQPDSDQTFDVFQFLLDVIGKVREGENFEGAVLTYPTSFDFRTDADILDDIRIARESGAPTHIINSLMYQYINNRFYTESDTARVSELIMAADRLLTLNNDQIIQRKAQGAVDNWEIVLHDSAFTLINELIDEDGGFLDLELQAQVDSLEARAKQKTPSGINTNQARADRLLNGIIGN